jgi:hypothetical protein
VGRPTLGFRRLWKEAAERADPEKVARMPGSRGRTAGRAADLPPLPLSGDGGFRLAPLVLDASVLIEAARGDAGVMTLLQGYDADGQPLIMPVLAVTR